MFGKRGLAQAGLAHITVGLAAILAGGMLLAGCSGNSASSSSTSGMPVRAAPAGGGAAAAGSAPAPTAHVPAGSTGTTVRLAPASIVYTAQLTVRAHDVSAAAANAARIAEDAGGYVSSENASAQPDDPSHATADVQLKIPVATYQATLGQLARTLGTQVGLQQQAQDVTQQVADVNSQVTSDEAAIAQLRTLLSHAGSVADLLSVQNQINTEESDLESMQAQQRALVHETSYATVTVAILGPKAKPVVHRPKPPPSLAAGLTGGWRALRVVVAWILAVLGAVAPFAAIAAIAAYAIYRGRRWLLRRRPAARPAAPES
jgi:hypothetical protein